MAFLKLIAASDNRCKNTYEYLDPVTHKICLAQDDMDTIMLTDNVGRKTKPYYVEEHDIDPSGKPYFNGSDNNFFSLMDAAYESELQAMMNSIFNQMQTVKFGESAEACLQNYFYSVQEYFPAVAFNETARLLYEEASVAQSNNIYTNGTPAISQSLGNQLEAEKQWFKRRLKYLQSWSKSDPFYVRSNNAALQFRSIVSGNTQSSYQFTLSPWQWLYPKVGIGQSLGADNVRVQAQANYTTGTLTTDGNTDTYIYGIDYYISLGEFGGQAIGETFNLSGKRLLEFSADSRQVTNYLFTPIAMTVNCPVLKRLSLYGCSTLGGSLDLSNEKKLVSVDLRNTSLTSLTLPETGTLTTVNLPALSSLYFVNCPNAFVQSMEYTNYLSVTTDNSNVALGVVNNSTNLTTIDFRNIDLNITNSTISNKMYDLLVTGGNSCTGTVQLNKTLTTAEKNTLVAKYGNIDSSNNSLHVIYNSSSSDSIVINGNDLIAKGRTKTYVVSYSGNDAIKYNWTVTNAESYNANGNSCSITAKTDSNTSIEITVVMTRVNNTSLSAQKTITVAENVPITGIENNDYEISNIGTYNIPIEYSPSNHTTYIDTINVTMSNSSYGRMLTYNKEQITIECYNMVTDTISTANVSISATDDEGNQITGSFNINFTNPVNQILLNGTTVIWTRQ